MNGISTYDIEIYKHFKTVPYYITVTVTVTETDRGPNGHHQSALTGKKR